MMHLGALESTQEATMIEMDKSLGVNLHFGAFSDTPYANTASPV